MVFLLGFTCPNEQKGSLLGETFKIALLFSKIADLIARNILRNTEALGKESVKIPDKNVNPPAFAHLRAVVFIELGMTGAPWSAPRKTAAPGGAGAAVEFFAVGANG